MNLRVISLFCLMLVVLPGSLALAATRPQDTSVPSNYSDDIEGLRDLVAEMKSTYENRISVLEQRLQRLESEQASFLVERNIRARDMGSAVAANATQIAPNNFNPAIGLILSGTLSDFNKTPLPVPGFLQGEESGPGEKGFSLGESEFDASANIDDKFYGNFTLSIANDAGGTVLDVEEAWLQTLSLPLGFTLKAGRFFSGLGHRNEFHAHADDFADRSLAYRVMLNGQYLDDGVQARWLAPTDRYLELGAEWLAGHHFPTAGADRGGKGAWVLFARTGGDVGSGNSWQSGVSWLNARARGLESGDPRNPASFSGEVHQALMDFVWKWAPNGNPYRNNLKIEGVVMWQNHDGSLLPGEPAAPSAGILLGYDQDQWGYSLEGVYQFMPRWRAGLRYSQLGGDALKDSFQATILDDQGQNPRVFTTMLDWSNSEFSRLRLQYSRDDSSARGNNQFFLQYLMSVGAHGAHQF